MLIPCPVCGLRDHSEFSYEGDATVPRPPIEVTDEAVWAAYVYDRANPMGPHREYWQHVHGCRQVLLVERDTATHHVRGAAIIGPWAGRTEGAEA